MQYPLGVKLWKVCCAYGFSIWIILGVRAIIEVDGKPFEPWEPAQRFRKESPRFFISHPNTAARCEEDLEALEAEREIEKYRVPELDKLEPYER